MNTLYKYIIKVGQTMRGPTLYPEYYKPTIRPDNSSNVRSLMNSMTTDDIDEVTREASTEIMSPYNHIPVITTSTSPSYANSQSILDSLTTSPDYMAPTNITKNINNVDISNSNSDDKYIDYSEILDELAKIGNPKYYPLTKHTPNDTNPTRIAANERIPLQDPYDSYRSSALRDVVHRRYSNGEIPYITKEYKYPITSTVTPRQYYSGTYGSDRVEAELSAAQRYNEEYGYPSRPITYIDEPVDMNWYSTDNDTKGGSSGAYLPINRWLGIGRGDVSIKQDPEAGYNALGSLYNHEYGHHMDNLTDPGNHPFDTGYMPKELWELYNDPRTPRTGAYFLSSPSETDVIMHHMQRNHFANKGKRITTPEAYDEYIRKLTPVSKDPRTSPDQPYNVKEIETLFETNPDYKRFLLERAQLPEDLRNKLDAHYRRALPGVVSNRRRSNTAYV